MGDLSFIHGLEFICFTKDVNSYAVAGPLTMNKVEDGVYAPPTFTLGNTAVQQLMDDLWNSGARPSECINSESKVGALTRHLEDMRTIAFAGLKIPSPNKS